MKKIIVLFLCCFLGLSLISCTTKESYPTPSQDVSSIKCIEIYSLEEAYYTEATVLNLRKENIPVRTIDDEKDISDFVSYISTLKFQKVIVHFPIPMDGGYDYYGYVIAIVYDNGYDIIAGGGLFSYFVNSDGKEHFKYDYSDYCGDENWSEMFENFVNSNMD